MKLYYDPKENVIYEGIYFTAYCYYLLTNDNLDKGINITDTWIPDYFEYLGEL